MCGEEDIEPGRETVELSLENVAIEEELEVSLNSFSNSVNPHIFRIPAKLGKET